MSSYTRSPTDINRYFFTTRLGNPVSVFTPSGYQCWGSTAYWDKPTAFFLHRRHPKLAIQIQHPEEAHHASHQ